VKTGTAGGKSNVLVDQNGCALYLNTQDTPSSSNCTDGCEATWLPAAAPGQPGPGIEASNLGTFQRSGGLNQVTYMGHQLYRFVGDTAPGQANGEGQNGIWFLVGTDGQPVK
jgi:predicted lipoprotein with Yx(FWY)xxD motif